MTKRTVVEELLIDDIDGAPAIGTFAFAVDGAHYEIELSRRNASALEKALAPYIAHARKVRGPKNAKANGHAKANSSVRSQIADRAMELARIRAWAGENGFEVAERGRVPQSVVEAYQAAH